MKKIIFVACFLAVILFCARFSFSRRIPETIIRVGLVQSEKSFNLSCEGNYCLYELNSGNKAAIAPMNDYLVRGSRNGIRFNGKVFSSPVRIVSEKNENRLRINGRRYRDSILINCRGGKLTVINELGIEDYLYGILPEEVNAGWPVESLKAQAVVSRTYALRNLRRHQNEGFDICTKTHCQVYGGMESEDERSNKAVDLTRGEVLVYDGQLAQALFHASCAGHTENPNNVWSWEGAAPQYLSGRPDKFCSNSPHNCWDNRISPDFIRAKLARAGYKIGKISKIKMSGKSDSGRAEILKISHSRGTLSIPAAKFRLAVDPWLIKSTLFTGIERTGKYFEFSGKGWGHGVGMCQWGAKEMAGQNYGYREILEYFYPGTQVEKWDE